MQLPNATTKENHVLELWNCIKGVHHKYRAFVPNGDGFAVHLACQYHVVARHIVHWDEGFVVVQRGSVEYRALGFSEF